MKLALLTLFFVLNVVSGTSSAEEHIESQYLFRVDELMFKTKSQLLEFSSNLEQRFNIYFVKHIDLKTVKFLFFKGEASNIMAASEEHGVLYVQPNMIHSITQTCQEESAPGVWGLERIGQREALPYNDPESPDVLYEWGVDTGLGAVVYVADTGLDYTHSQFGGRAAHGFTASDIPYDEDNNGHGTHCAGTVGAELYGVAKEVQLIGVKVLGDSGAGSSVGILEGLQYVQDDHDFRSEIEGRTAKSVINLSLGVLGGDDAMDDGTQALIDGGVITVIAAGNMDINACNFSPARVPDAITVGAMNVNDVTWRASNWGECVDLYAPGEDILSTQPGEASVYASGTSMATPAVAGVIARYQSSLDNAPTQQQVSLIVTQFSFMTILT